MSADQQQSKDINDLRNLAGREEHRRPQSQQQAVPIFQQSKVDACAPAVCHMQHDVILHKGKETAKDVFK